MFKNIYTIAYTGRLVMAYLLLSEKINAPVVTADDKLHEKAMGHFKVIHLKDYV
jgi:predicted nucleic acid-binding protein